MTVKVEKEICGRMMSFETGKLAKQAEGAVLVRYGNTAMLATAVSSDKPVEAGYFPLSVEFEERFYSSGKIKGSRFVKREGRPSDWAILAARLTDRPIRPLFPKESRNEVQVVCTLLSVDFENEPEPLAIIGASAALMISPAPFMGPVAGVKVGYVDGQIVVNPTYAQMEKSTLELTVAGTKDGINMVEAGANEVTEDVMADALDRAHAEIKNICAFQEELVARLNPAKKTFVQRMPAPEIIDTLEARFGDEIVNLIKGNIAQGGPDADVRTKDLFSGLYDQLEAMVDENTDMATLNNGLFNVVGKKIRESILNDGLRPDGRRTTDIRPIEVEVGLFKTNHGSALFTRGGTQALTMTTLGMASEAQIIDSTHLKEEYKKRYLHFYNAPPYSVGETGRMSGPKRREIGHGALAERALVPVLPDMESFPYTMLLVSEVLGQNGSSSMASVCGSTLSLMDAGVPIRKPVAGIAMGLVFDNDDRYAILSDIQGMEDFVGDMDFKVAGTETGITALQMDIKIKGIKPELLRRALAQAREGRMHILSKMTAVISAPRPQLSPYAPQIVTLRIDPEKIRDVIGSGGKVINGIIAATGTKIDIEDDGLVMISSNDADGLNRAVAIVKSIVTDPEPGTIYNAKVTRVMDFGAFVEFMPGKEGLVHISQLAPFRVEKVEDIVKLGDELKVKLLEIDSQGRYNLSKKAADAESQG
jgi:polyribonucleotide nucleotidyltransferase